MFLENVLQSDENGFFNKTMGSVIRTFFCDAVGSNSDFTNQGPYNGEQVSKCKALPYS